MTTSTVGFRTAAFFDVDGTIVRGTIAHYYAYFRCRRMNPTLAKIWYAFFVAKCGYYLLLDKVNRNTLNRVFYRGYRGLPADEIKSMAMDCHCDIVQPNTFPDAVKCIRQHLHDEHLVVLVTGSLDFIVAPLAHELRTPYVIATSLKEHNGRFTGELTTAPLARQEKARRMMLFAEQEKIDLRKSFAYGDSIADLPMLEAVGSPAAVSPDGALEKLAEKRGWPIHRWTVADNRLR